MTSPFEAFESISKGRFRLDLPNPFYKLDHFLLQEKIVYTYEHVCLKKSE
jgi:hypothetical protein